MGLEKNAPRDICAPCAPRDLGQKLGHALLTPKVSAKQQCIRIDDRNKADRGKVVAFGQHLGAQQYAGLSPVDLGDKLLHGISALHGITVHASYRVPAETLSQKILCLLRAQTLRLQLAAVALGAAGWESRAAAAMVAAQLSAAAMDGQARITGRALRDPAAVVALQGRRIAAAVKE